MGIGWPQLLVVAVLVLVLFGRGKISEMMGDFGKGIKSFKQGMTEEEKADAKPSQQIEAPASDAASETKTSTPAAGKTTDSAK